MEIQCPQSPQGKNCKLSNLFIFNIQDLLLRMGKLFDQGCV